MLQINKIALFITHPLSCSVSGSDQGHFYVETIAESRAIWLHRNAFIREAEHLVPHPPDFTPIFFINEIT